MNTAPTLTYALRDRDGALVWVGTSLVEALQNRWSGLTLTAAQHPVAHIPQRAEPAGALA